MKKKFFYRSRTRLIKSIRKIMRTVQPFVCKRRKEKHILLFCNSTTTESHIEDYYQAVKNMENVKFFLFYLNMIEQPKAQHEEAVRRFSEKLGVPAISYRQTYLHFWDLIVSADILIPYRFCAADAPSIYVNHGLHIISHDGGEHTYAYQDHRLWDDYGKIVFAAMFEPNSNHVKVLKEEQPELKGILRHVGYKSYNAIRQEIPRKAEYRRQLGIKEDEILVSVFGTWNRESLFHKIGPELCRQAEELMKKNYRFVLSIHPHEYEQYEPSMVPLGPWVDSLAEKGFLIRSPKVDSTPYLIAADVVISDYSSLYELALIAEKPLILSDFSKAIVWKHSIAGQLMDQMPVFNSDAKLGDLIDAAMHSEQYQAIYHRFAECLQPPDNDYVGQVRIITKELLH